MGRGYMLLALLAACLVVESFLFVVVAAERAWGASEVAVPEVAKDTMISASVSEDAAIKALGIRAGERVTTGFVFINGKYLESPYTVSRRGRQVFVNNAMIYEYGNWPLPDRHVKEDPGLPTGLTAESAYYDIYDPKDYENSPFRRKLRYLYEKAQGVNIEQQMAEYFRLMPFVQSVEGTDVAGSLRIRTKAGDEYLIETNLSQIEIRYLWGRTNKDVIEDIEKRRSAAETQLKRGEAVFAFGEGPGFQGLSLDREKAARDLGLIAEILRSERSRGEKMVLLQRMEFLPLPGYDRMSILLPQGMEFQASKQLDERIAVLVRETGVTPRTLKDIPEEIPSVRANRLEREGILKELPPFKGMGEAAVVKELGEEEGKPVANGFVFIDGRYIEAPYTATRRGSALIINDAKVWDWPITYPDVDQEPGLPPGMTKNWTFFDLALWRPHADRWDLKERRWIECHFKPAEGEQKLAEYYRRMPFVKRVQSQEPDQLLVETLEGGIHEVDIGLPPPLPWTKRHILGELAAARKNVEYNLGDGACYMYFSGADEILLEPYKTAVNLGLVVEILSSDKSAADKLNLLQRMRFLKPKDQVQLPRLIAGFKGSNALTDRIAQAVRDQKAVPRRLEDLPAENAVAPAQGTSKDSAPAPAGKRHILEACRDSTPNHPLLSRPPPAVASLFGSPLRLRLWLRRDRFASSLRPFFAVTPLFSFCKNATYDDWHERKCHFCMVSKGIKKAPTFVQNTPTS